MRKLLVVLVALGALGLAVELAAPSIAERRIETSARQQVREATAVEADIDSFPMVTRLLATSAVSHVTITLTEVVRQSLRFSEVTLDLYGVTLDRDAMLRREARVREVEHGTVTAVVEMPNLPRIGAADVRVESGVAIVSVAGRSLLRVSLPDDLMPCRPDGRLEDRGLVLSCSFTGVPPALLEA